MFSPNDNFAEDRYQFAIWALKELRQRANGNLVYDIGPGDGRLAKIEEEGFVWRGLDRKAWKSVEAWDLSGASPRLPEKADFILFLEVLEHLPNPGLALENISNALVPGGFLIMTTPNPRWSGSRLNMLYRGLVSGFSPQDLEENHHVFTPWPHVLRHFLENAGLECERYVTLEGSTTLFRREGKLFFPARVVANVIQMLIEARDPASKGMTCGFVARKTGNPKSHPPYPTISC